jgi:endonuclease III-like uncharacterized protein
MKVHQMLHSWLIKKLCQSLIDQFNGEIPQTHKELESLAGVGRKTANVVMSVAFDEPSLAVDTISPLNWSIKDWQSFLIFLALLRYRPMERISFISLVNRVTTELFKKYKTPEDYLAVSDEELMNDIRSIGLYYIALTIVQQ